MGYSCFIKCYFVGFRFLRYKFSPWITLAIAPLKLLVAAGSDRTYPSYVSFRNQQVVNKAFHPEE